MVLRNECLHGDDEGILPDGTVVTLGLLVTQWREDLAPFFEREILLAMIQLVRSDEDAPAPHECFTLRWFREGSRLGRLDGRARQAAFRRALAEGAPDLVREMAKAKAMPRAPVDLAGP
jgi:hypothetical protein